MRIGAMDRRITIRRKTVVTDDYGAEIETWADAVTIWAGVTALRGTERFAASQTMASVDTRFKIRWRNDITPLDIIAYDGREYDISAVIPLGRQEALELYANTRAE